MFCNKHMHTAHAQHMQSNISHKFTHNNNTRKRTPNNASQQMHTTVHQWCSTRGWTTYSPTPAADGRGIGQGGCGHTGWECMRVCGVPRNRGWTPRRNKREKRLGRAEGIETGVACHAIPGLRHKLLFLRRSTTWGWGRRTSISRNGMPAQQHANKTTNIMRAHARTHQPSNTV